MTWFGVSHSNVLEFFNILCLHSLVAESLLQTHQQIEKEVPAFNFPGFSEITNEDKLEEQK